MTTPTIDELRQKAAAAKAKAKAAELTDEERERAALLASIREDEEAEAAAQIARLDGVMVQRVGAARARANGQYLVDGVNLLRLFPLGSAPGPVSKLPGGGVLVLRDPGEAYDAFTREIEAKQKPHAAIFTDLLCTCLVDERDKPQDDDERAAAAILLRAFCERYKGAAVAAGDVAAKLGGARAQADKRGRT